MNKFKTGYIDSAKQRYQKKRMANWNQIAQRLYNSKPTGTFYHKLLQDYYRFLVPPNMKVLEIGCGQGDLLASLHPELGVGVDFSEKMIRQATLKHPNIHFIQANAQELPIKINFDVIILSDLVNDLWDVQSVLRELNTLTHSGTRLIVNFFNNMWRVPLGIAKRLKLAEPILEQNWLTPHDIDNLMGLSNFEVINHHARILLPLNLQFLSNVLNKYAVNIIPFKWLALTNFVVARPTPDPTTPYKAEKKKQPSVSIIIPARNEAGNIYDIIRRTPDLGNNTELIFVEGHSTDNTYETIQQAIRDYPEKKCRLLQQTGKGKGDAVRLGFQNATGDVLMILDTDMTVPPEDLTRFFNAIATGKGEFINGVRLVYPMEDQAMRFINMVGNKFFSLMFSWLLGQPIKDTLCGTKVLWQNDYQRIAQNRKYFGDFDPFGDFDLLFGAAKLNLKIAEIPIRYRNRTYGDTNIDRWKHGWLLIKMVVFAAKCIKFI